MDTESEVKSEVKTNTKLETKVVGQIKGNFFIPSYQRGYRWGKNEVERLLTDIYQNGDHSYCLQPIVVRRSNNTYRVVDGQQRLTTIYLIYKYIRDIGGNLFDSPRFTIIYETRIKSAQFLASTYQEMAAQKDENIDYWFMYNAYSCIDEWFSDETRGFKSDLVGEISRRLNKFVRVIWYEIDETEDEKKLFTRLNIGKIPLTSAELIKAMFLSNTITREITHEQKEEIALAWDNIEKELSHEPLWYFLTNQSSSKYQTRIDLVLDLMSNRPAGSEPYYTFFYFDQQKQTKDPEKIWNDIEQTFMLLKDWYEDHELYHKIGYLISSGSRTLHELYQHFQKSPTKSAFKKSLDQEIAKSIDIKDRKLEDLNYNDDYDTIQKILLLFNVESVSQNDEETLWFPFDKLKQQDWSLEHIHAQRSESMNRQELWLKWLELQLDSLKNVIDDKDLNDKDLVARIEKYLAEDTISRNDFEDVKDKIVAKLSSDNNEEYIHTIANLALLNSGDNSALSNSTFDVKRTKIIKMDQSGKFIPLCTKMVFLKYYTDSGNTQLHFWCEEDRKCYLDHIKQILANYINTEEPTDAE
ncbi:DUF262 domain-containing protein [Candidatus Saccharibacteria bacterium]|nr:DUF262 domain-containing protein [Candidatus Saccharibacteria bacterium]